MCLLSFIITFYCRLSITLLLAFAVSAGQHTVRIPFVDGMWSMPLPLFAVQSFWIASLSASLHCPVYPAFFPVAFLPHATDMPICCRYLCYWVWSISYLGVGFVSRFRVPRGGCVFNASVDVLTSVRHACVLGSPRSRFACRNVYAFSFIPLDR